MSTYPLSTVLAFIAAVSVVAGIAEEAGCRGYMQLPIELRHGPLVAILVVGGMFWLFHAAAFVGRWGTFLRLLWFYLAASVVFGALAHLSGSIRPGIVLHATANLVGFGLVWWFESGPGANAANGRPYSAVIGGATLLLCIAATWAYRRLALVARRTPATIDEFKGPP